MKHRLQRVSTAIVLVVLALAISACGAGSTHSTNPSPSTTSLVPPCGSSGGPPSCLPPTTATPVPAARHDFTVSAGFTTPDGYSFEVTADAAIGAPSPADSAQLAPGQNAIVIPVSGDATIRNTTPGRDAPSDPISNATLMGLWKSPSAVCPVKSQGSLDAGYMSLNSTAYCIGQLLTIQDPNNNPISAGQALTLSAMPATCENQDNIPGGCGTVPTPPGDVAFDYLSPHEATALRSLANPPDMVVLVGPSDTSPSRACSPSDSLGWIIASSKPITSCS